MYIAALVLTILAAAFMLFVYAAHEALDSITQVATIPESISIEVQQRTRATAKSDLKALGRLSYGIAIFSILAWAGVFTLSMVGTLPKEDFFATMPLTILALFISGATWAVAKFAFETAKKLDLKLSTV